LDQAGQTKEAADGLERFLASHPAQTAELPAWLGMLRDSLGEWPAGESAHRAAVSLGGSSAKLHNNLGYNLWKQSKRIDAIEEFRRALELDPKLEVARNNLGLALMEGAEPGEMKEALGHFTAAAADPAAAHNNAAAVLIGQGRYVEARNELEQSLRHRSDYLPALRNLDLVSRLDAKPAALPQAEAAQEGRLGRWASVIWHGFLGTERKKPQSGLPVAGNR
jgi:Tfp pilus assembly protein PilF